MAKRIEMTRARQIALPVILKAAQERLDRYLEGPGKAKGDLERALEAFK